MPNQKNLDSVAAIQANLDKAQSLIIADYSGLKLSAQTTLRAVIKDAGGEMIVAKNRLVMRAIKNKLKDLPSSVEAALQGPNAVIYGFTDAVTATKAVVDFAKTNDALEVKAGLMFETDSTQVLSKEQVLALAALPSRPELLTKLVSTLNAPLNQLAQVLSGNSRQLVYVLTALKTKLATN